MSITETNEYRALADKARLGDLSPAEAAQWKQFQAQAASEQRALDAGKQAIKTINFQRKVAALPVAPTAQKTLLAAAPRVDAVAPTAPEDDGSRRRRARMAAAGTLFTMARNPLGGAPSTTGGQPGSLGGGRTLLS